MLVKNFWFIAALLFAPYAAAQVSSGTAFAVAPGLLVTNQHVVDGCASVEVLASDGRRTGAVVDADARIDLALIRVTGLKGATARLRSPRNVRLGEAVMVFGFPLSGSLSSGGNFTSGLVSALRGFRDAAGEIQITAPVQPGNSGGPLMDASGLVIGVVQAKLDALRTARITGDIPQNVNFAISLEVLADFLAKNRVAFQDSSSSAPLDTARVAELAQSFTYYIECRGRSQQATASSSTKVEPPASQPVKPPVQTYEKTETYCNGRFAFSIDIPTQILIPQPPPTNGNGRRFVSKDGSAVLRVYGSSNHLRKKLIDRYVEESNLSDKPAQTLVTYKVIKDDWFVISGYEGDKIFYQKEFLVDDQFKTFIFTFPHSKRAIYEPLIAGFAASFNGKHRNQKSQVSGVSC